MARAEVPPPDSVFTSESAWPFQLRGEQLADCQSFLADGDPGPRLLRVSGPSGTGKSFLVRELLVQAATSSHDAIGVYLDVPPGELEASELLARVDQLLSDRRTASRDAPSFVNRRAARSWLAAKRGRSSRWLAYLYLAVRDLIAQIPAVGPFIKALLPQTGHVATEASDSSAPLRFLMRQSRSHPVWLAIDNTQFLPLAVKASLAASFTEAGSHLRLVLIERVRGRRINWMPPIPQAEVRDIEIDSASLEEIDRLVVNVLPEAQDHEQLAATIFRRSGGNLKSVWYQLRLIAARREDQEDLPTSYEDVIETLPSLDQAVLRFVVFTIGGLTIASLIALLQATDLHLRSDAVGEAISDMAALGLLVVNGDSSDRVRVEHELVAQVVSDLTPEEEKLELRSQAVTALSSVLTTGVAAGDKAVLYDRLLGIVDGVELRRSPTLLSLVVRFIQEQTAHERYGYLSGICRDSACWDVLDDLPETTVRSLLDAIQKSSLFEFGLIATTRLRRSGVVHESLASLYEAKYLVQLFRYDEANTVLERLPNSPEKRGVSFNITLNLAQDDDASKIATAVYTEIVDGGAGTEQDYLILRNAAHLFPPDDARTMLEVALAGFQALGSSFAVATTTNNLGIIDLTTGSHAAARTRFNEARRTLLALDSAEVYQPLVNLSALAFVEGNTRAARRFLDTARTHAPASLLQDETMLDFNAIALDVYSGSLDTDVVGRMNATAAAARRTRDLRFVDLATWFAETLEASLARTAPPTSAAQRRVVEIRKTGRVPIEVFVSVDVGDASLDVPFVLSPHWRY